MQKVCLIVPVERPKRSRKKVKKQTPHKNAVVTLQPCFNTDIYTNGAAINMSYHTGEITHGIIAESTKDWIKVYIVNKQGQCLIREIELEDYINGVWIIKLL